MSVLYLEETGGVVRLAGWRVLGVVSLKIGWIGLVVAGSLWAQPSAGTLSVSVSREMVPVGGMALIKVWVSPPAPIVSGGITLRFDESLFPPAASQVAGATVFSASGDVSAVAAATGFPETGRFEISFYSSSGGVGRVPGLPVAEIAIPATAASPVRIESVGFSGPGGLYRVVTSDGGVAVGGTLSVRQVTTTGSRLGIDGTGFTGATSVTVDGAVVAGVTLESSERIDVTLAAATEITGKHIRVRNPDGEQVDTWGGLRLQSGVMYTAPLPAASSGGCAIAGPSLEEPVAMVLENPGNATAEVTVSNAFLASGTGLLSTTIAAGGTYATSIVDPANSTFQGSVPLRVFCYYRQPYGNPADMGVVPPVTLQPALPTMAWIGNAGWVEQGAVWAGEIVTIFGTNFGDTPAVTFDGIAAQVFYGSGTQVNAVVPAEVAGRSSTVVQVSAGGAVSAAWTMPVAAARRPPARK